MKFLPRLPFSILPILLVGLALSGCSLQLLTPPAAQETRLFAQGLDRYLASGDLTALKRLPQQYPQGEWRLQAAGLIAMAERHQAVLKQKDQEIADGQESAELTRCHQEQVALTQDNLLLEKTLQRLKEVLIDTELQAK